jgi:hypothetical protein
MGRADRTGGKTATNSFCHSVCFWRAFKALTNKHRISNSYDRPVLGFISLIWTFYIGIIFNWLVTNYCLNYLLFYNKLTFYNHKPVSPSSTICFSLANVWSSHLRPSFLVWSQATRQQDSSIKWNFILINLCILIRQFTPLLRPVVSFYSIVLSLCHFIII